MKRLLISITIAVSILSASMVTGQTVAVEDIINDCIKCPGLQMILEMRYKFIAIV